MQLSICCMLLSSVASTEGIVRQQNVCVSSSSIFMCKASHAGEGSQLSVLVVVFSLQCLLRTPLDTSLSVIVMCNMYHTM